MQGSASRFRICVTSCALNEARSLQKAHTSKPPYSKVLTGSQNTKRQEFDDDNNMPLASSARVSTHAIHPQQRGTQVAGLVAQQPPQPPHQGRLDYVRANRAAIRGLERSQQTRKMIEAEAAAAEREREQWKMSRFGAIRSRIAAIIVS